MSRFLNRPCMRRRECACVSVIVDICYCFFSLKEARFVSVYSRIICHKSQMFRKYLISNMSRCVEFWMTIEVEG